MKKPRAFFLRRGSPLCLGLAGWIAFLCAGSLTAPLLAEDASTAKIPAASNPPLSGDQWKAVVEQFENSVFSAALWLEKEQVERNELKADVADLQAKTASLRRKTEADDNVIDEIRLKGYLNDLKDKLEKDAALQRQWDERQKDFEQKSLSLVSLYNDRIESELETTDVSTGMDPLDSKLKVLDYFIQKRTRVQALLRLYQKKNENERTEPMVPFESLKTDDKESLQLTLGLFRDRKRDLEEGLEKLSLEEDETKNELKLQGKMEDFIQDVRRINSDSNLPQEDPKNSPLAGLSGRSQKEKIESKLADLQKRIAHDEKTLIQVNLLMGRIQRHLDNLEAGRDR